jgi:pyruvate/2-oxoglutarate dehydrogenase complex dihydrolipoamide dehydrogenase (E3) component
MNSFDVAVIGGGSAGYAAARTAHEAGAKVAIIDQGPLGGLCILRGCMPSKAILRSAEILSYMRRAKEFGLLDVLPQADLNAIMNRKDSLVNEFAEYRIQQLRDNRFTLYESDASFVSPTELRVGDVNLTTSQTIIATGSSIRSVNLPGLETAGYITSDDALQLRTPPKSMLVLGGGPTATELAQFYCRIGTKVTIIQRSDHILSSGDKDLALPLEKQLRSEGMEIFTSCQIQKIEIESKMRVAHFTQSGISKKTSAEVILLALGRRPNIDDLGLENAGIKINNGKIIVDSEMRTNQRNIFAVGDVNGLHEVVHEAVKQGEVAGYNATRQGLNARNIDNHLPIQITFTNPQIASVGLSEKDCIATATPYLSATYPFDDHGKSMCLGETNGHVKLICCKNTGRLIGAHIVGPEASEIIHELIAIMYFRGTAQDILQIPHYHPTLSEILTYPAEDILEQLNS